MPIDLEPDEIEALIEGLDCLKTKIAFVNRRATYEEKTAKLAKAEALEMKLRRALTPG